MAKAAAPKPMVDDGTEEHDVRLYECCVLYPYPMNQKEEQQLLKQIEEIFAETGAKLVEKDSWGRRGLAYSIGGSTEGNFVIYYYEAKPSAMREIDRALHIVPGLLRHLIIKPPKGYHIAKFSEAFATWVKERETVDEQRARRKEEALQEKVVAKAKRQVKEVEKQKKEVSDAKPALTGEKLTEQLEKIISDDELDL